MLWFAKDFLRFGVFFTFFLLLAVFFKWRKQAKEDDCHWPQDLSAALASGSLLWLGIDIAVAHHLSTAFSIEERIDLLLMILSMSGLIWLLKQRGRSIISLVITTGVALLVVIGAIFGRGAVVKGGLITDWLLAGALLLLWLWLVVFFHALGRKSLELTYTSPQNDGPSGKGLSTLQNKKNLVLNLRLGVALITGVGVLIWISQSCTSESSDFITQLVGTLVVIMGGVFLALASLGKRSAWNNANELEAEWLFWVGIRLPEMLGLRQAPEIRLGRQMEREGEKWDLLRQKQVWDLYDVDRGFRAKFAGQKKFGESRTEDFLDGVAPFDPIYGAGRAEVVVLAAPKGHHKREMLNAILARIFDRNLSYLQKAEDEGSKLKSPVVHCVLIDEDDVPELAGADDVHGIISSRAREMSLREPYGPVLVAVAALAKNDEAWGFVEFRRMLALIAEDEELARLRPTIAILYEGDISPEVVVNFRNAVEGERNLFSSLERRMEDYLRGNATMRVDDQHNGESSETDSGATKEENGASKENLRKDHNTIRRPIGRARWRLRLFTPNKVERYSENQPGEALINDHERNYSVSRAIFNWFWARIARSGLENVD